MGCCGKPPDRPNCEYCDDCFIKSRLTKCCRLISSDGYTCPNPICPMITGDYERLMEYESEHKVKKQKRAPHPSQSMVKVDKIHNEKNQTCVICLDEIKNEATVKVSCNCAQHYHEVCLSKWFQTHGEHSCPICKKVVS